jgi:hypothetical protein
LILSMPQFLQTLHGHASKTWLLEPCSWKKKGEKSKAMTRSPTFFIILHRAMNVPSCMWIYEYYATLIHSFSQQMTVSLYYLDTDKR